MDDVRVYKTAEKSVALTQEVDEILRRHAGVIRSAAMARLARHRKTGTHKITVSKERIDHFVHLKGRAALSVEEGHWAGEGGARRFVRGLDIVKGAIR